MTIEDVHPAGIKNQEILVTVKSSDPTTYISPLGFPAYPEDAQLSAYALVNVPISGTDPFDPLITVTSPNGGEFWHIGSPQDVTWDWQGYIPAVNVHLSLDGGSTWPLELAHQITNTGLYELPQVGLWPSNDAFIRVTSSIEPTILDTSDDNFTIGFTQKSITLNVPNGGEIWAIDSSEDITWETTGNVLNVKLLVSTDSGANFDYVVEESIENTGTYTWGPIPTELESETCRVRIEDVVNPGIYDVSDQDFKIINKWLQVTKPNGGEEVKVGEEYEITWASSDGIDDVKIEYSTDGGATYPNEITPSTTNDGSYLWTPLNTPTTAARVRITDVGGSQAVDASNANFTITEYMGQIELLTPNGGEIWYTGEGWEITWLGNADIAAVDISISYTPGDGFPYIGAAGEVNDGSFMWDPIPLNAVGDNLRMKISDSAYPDVKDFSDGLFDIQESVMEVYIPNGGEMFYIDTDEFLTWDLNNNTDFVKIEYSTDSGATYPNTIIDSTNNDGIYKWTIPDIESETCRIKVSALDGAQMSDESDADFTIIFDPTWQGWTHTWQAHELNAGNTVELDSVGNIYVGGNIIVDMNVDYDLDPTPGVFLYSLDNYGASMFICKFESDGSFLDGTILFRNLVDSSVSDDDIFYGTHMFGAFRLDSGLDIDWYGGWSGSGIYWPNGIDVITDAEMYFTGGFSNTMDFWFGPGTENRTAGVGSDTFVVKYGDWHEPEWIRHWGGSVTAQAYEDQGIDIVTDDAGNVFVVGVFEGACDFNPEGTHDFHGTTGNIDCYLTKLDSNGGYGWTRTWGGAGQKEEDVPYSVALDSGGNIYVTGTFTDTVDFDPGSGENSHTSIGSTDIFLSKFDSSGNLLWVRTIGGTGSDYGKCVNVDPYGNTYLTGAFSNTVEFGIDEDSHELTSMGGLDVFVLSYNSGGQLNWVGAVGGEDDDIGNAIVSTSAGAYVTGSYAGMCDFDPGINEDFRFATAYGTDAFLMFFPENGNGL